MTFYILLNHITTLFVSLGLLTTLTFESEVTSYMYGGAKEDLFMQVTNNMRTLAIKPKREGIASNLLVITKNRKYYFNVRYDSKNPHQFIEVKDGIINHGMRELLNAENYQLMEGESSVMVINRGKKPLKVNDSVVETKEYFSKGVPIIIENNRVLN